MRKRYRQDSETGKLIEIVRGQKATLHSVKVTDSFVSSIDGSTIRGAQDLREHNARNNVSSDPDHLGEQVKRSQNRSHTLPRKERIAAIRDSIERTSSSGFHRHVQYED